MIEKRNASVLVVGFNTRPLVYSLNRCGFDVYAIDFFGDIDLYPYVKDCIIITKELGTSYNLIKNKYSKFLVDFAVSMLEKYPYINYLILGSGLDNALEERTYLINEINKKNLLYIIILLQKELLLRCYKCAPKHLLLLVQRQKNINLRKFFPFRDNVCRCITTSFLPKLSISYR